MPTMVFNMLDLGPLQIDAATLGPLVTILLIALILVREVLTSLDRPVPQARYLDVIIAPLMVVFILMVFITIA